jgi:hypothetical protein
VPPNCWRNRPASSSSHELTIPRSSEVPACTPGAPSLANPMATSRTASSRARPWRAVQPGAKEPRRGRRRRRGAASPRRVRARAPRNGGTQCRQLTRAHVRCGRTTPRVRMTRARR